jgi:hypothetical protein
MIWTMVPTFFSAATGLAMFDVLAVRLVPCRVRREEGGGRNLPIKLVLPSLLLPPYSSLAL